MGIMCCQRQRSLQNPDPPSCRVQTHLLTYHHARCTSFYVVTASPGHIIVAFSSTATSKNLKGKSIVTMRSILNNNQSPPHNER